MFMWDFDCSSAEKICFIELQGLTLIYFYVIGGKEEIASEGFVHAKRNS